MILIYLLFAFIHAGLETVWPLAIAPQTQSKPLTPGSNYNILAFGAKNDKAVNSQTGIQRAIDACAQRGGGRVIIPTGNFSTATVRLKDNVELHLAKGANLYAIADSAMYTNEKEGLKDAGDTFIPALISAKQVKNIRITGESAIIGEPQFYYSAVTWNDEYPGWNENARNSGVNMTRPWVKNPKISLVYISDCENVTIRNVSIINSPNWSCYIQWSQNITVTGVKITSSLERGVNSDGLDIDGCKKVTVTGCIIRTGDDAISGFLKV